MLNPISIPAGQVSRNLPTLPFHISGGQLVRTPSPFVNLYTYHSTSLKPMLVPHVMIGLKVLRHLLTNLDEDNDEVNKQKHWVYQHICHAKNEVSQHGQLLNKGKGNDKQHSQKRDECQNKKPIHPCFKIFLEWLGGMHRIKTFLDPFHCNITRSFLGFGGRIRVWPSLSTK